MISKLSFITRFISLFWLAPLTSMGAVAIPPSDFLDSIGTMSGGSRLST
jgi:hypothetical protein